MICMLVMCGEDMVVLMHMHKNVDCQMFLCNMSFIQIASQNSDPQDELKHSKTQKQKKLVFLRFSFSTCSLVLLTTQLQDVNRSPVQRSITCSLVWLIGLSFTLLRRPIFYAQCHPNFFLGYEGILYVSGLNI